MIPSTRPSVCLSFCSFRLLKFFETGLIDAGIKRHVNFPTDSMDKQNLWLSAQLNNVFSAFACLVGGWTLSIIIFTFELFFSKRRCKISIKSCQQNYSQGHYLKKSPFLKFFFPLNPFPSSILCFSFNLLIIIIKLNNLLT